MNIEIDDTEFLLRYFVVCEFYGVETCFCWNAEKFIVFPYANGTTARDINIFSSLRPMRKIQFFDGRAFFICTPQGAYKFLQTKEFAILSKNALGLGRNFFEVLVAKNNGIYLYNKQIKSSTLLFSIDSNGIEAVCTFPLILKNTEIQFVNCFIANSQSDRNLCIIAHCEKLFVLKEDIVQLIYNNDDTIVDIISVKRQNNVAGLLLLNRKKEVILMYGRDNNLIFEKIHLKKDKDISALCAGFSPRDQNVLWLMYSDQYGTYRVKKELFVDTIQETKVLEGTFSCMQHYKPNIILGLQKKELIELSLEEMENPLPINNDIKLHTNMFKKTDIIMEEIYERVKELNALYEKLTDERDKLQRINFYASKWSLQSVPLMEVSRIYNYTYLTLSILEELPKDSYMVFTYVSNNQNTFCMKKVTGTSFMVKMPINEYRIQCSSSINIDLITLINEQCMWCVIRNFISFPPQNVKRKRGLRNDKTAFIDAKITLLQNLIAKADLNMNKLCEIKQNIRTVLYIDERKSN